MRIKRGKVKHKKHKKVLKLAKGYRLSYSKLYRRAKEALLHAGQYSIQHRKKRKGQFRKLWIQRINAALSKHDVKYSKFIKQLDNSKIVLNRKMLADLALNYDYVFSEIVKETK